MKKLILNATVIAFLAGCGEPDSKDDGVVVEEYTVKIIKKKDGEDITSLKNFFNEETIRAKANTYVNQAQMLQAMGVLYEVMNGKKAESISELYDWNRIENPQFEPPKTALNGKWEMDKKYFFAVGEATDRVQEHKICEEINNVGSGIVFCVKGENSIKISMER